MHTGTLLPRVPSSFTVVEFQPHQKAFLDRRTPSGLPFGRIGPQVLPILSFFIIALHTISSIPGSRWSSHRTSLPHIFSNWAFESRFIGNPNSAGGVLTGKSTGGSKRVPGLLALPLGGKIGARKNMLS